MGSHPSILAKRLHPGSPSRQLLRLIVGGVVTLAAIACQPQDSTPSGPENLPRQTSDSATEDAPELSPQVEKRQYVGIQFDFQFEYPTEYFVESTLFPETGDRIPLERVDLWSPDAYATIRLEEPSPNEQPPNVSVTIYPNPRLLSLEEWAVQTELAGASPTAIRELTVAGQEAIAFFSSGQSDDETYDYENVAVAGPDDSKVILITLDKGRDAGTEAAYRVAYQTVASTLTFGPPNLRFP